MSVPGGCGQKAWHRGILLANDLLDDRCWRDETLFHRLIEASCIRHPQESLKLWVVYLPPHSVSFEKSIA